MIFIFFYLYSPILFYFYFIFTHKTEGIEMRLSESTAVVEERERCIEKKVKIYFEIFQICFFIEFVVLTFDDFESYFIAILFFVRIFIIFYFLYTVLDSSIIVFFYLFFFFFFCNYENKLISVQLGIEYSLLIIY